MDWSPYFPRYFGKDANNNTKKVDFIDVGCGYGGKIKLVNKYLCKNFFILIIFL